MKDEQTLFKAAVLKLLRPILKMALRNQVTHQLFDEWVKRIYIDVAEEEFALQKRKPSDSRTSLLTGLTRKDIRRLKQEEDQPVDTEKSYHRCLKILSAWRREPEFSDDQGEAKVLPLSGEVSFESLVKKYGKDVPARAVLDELSRLKNVEVKDDLVTLKSDALVPEVPSSETQFHILGQDVSALVDTIDHNTYQRDEKKRFQRHVRYVGIPQKALAKLEKNLEKRGQAFLEDFDEWLSHHCESELAEGQKTILIGLYYHEGDVDV